MIQPEVDLKMRILLAAKSLFAKHGFDGTSVRKICEEAGANIALVSYHFGGKENVLRAIFETFMPLLKIDFLTKKVIDPLASLKLMITEVLSFHLLEPEVVTIIRQETMMNSPRAALMSPYTLRIWRHLREILQKGKEEGIFEYKSLDNTMFFIMGTLLFHRHSTIFDELLEEGLQTQEKIAEEMYEYILGGSGAGAIIKET